MTRKFLTIKEAASLLGVSPLTLRNWDKSGKFKASRHPMNNYRVYKIEDIERLTEEIGSNTSTITKRKDRNKTKKLQIKHLDA